LAGVSRTTVSFVLNNVPGVKISDETRQRVLDAARELEYYPTAAARSLASGKAQRIGIILGEGQGPLSADAFWPGLLQGVTSAVRRNGYRVVVQTAEDITSREAYLSLIREQEVDGLILSGPRSDDPLLPQLAEERFPMVLHGFLPDVPFPCVDVDNRSGARRAVQHLLNLGHRTIGFISNAPFSHASAQGRLAGYQQALEENGLEFNLAYVRESDFLPETGQAAMESLLGLPVPPTAVFAAGDVIALGALQAVRAAGLRVPDDVALVGFDDLFFAAYASPPLTTIHVPAYGLGWTAAVVLIALIEGDLDAPSVTLDTDLVVRGSCGARRTSAP
jgi:DNA-binding LacI/PurR family transcriptional regulator